MSKIFAEIKYFFYGVIMNVHLDALETAKKEGNPLLIKVYSKRAIKTGEKVLGLEKKFSGMAMFPGVVEEMVNRLKYNN